MLNLCYVADAGNIHVRRVLSFFAARGHTVTCLSETSGEIEGVMVHVLPSNGTNAQARAIRRHLAETGADVVHAIFTCHRGWAAALSGASPLVVSVLGPDVYLPADRALLSRLHDQLLNVLTLRQCDMVTAVSDDLDRIATRLTLKQIPVELIPIGTDPKLFVSGQDVTSLREQLHIPDDAYVVFSPRQITPHYNQETIVDAIPAVLEEVPEAVFVFKDTFGGHASHSPEERRAYVNGLRCKAEAMGIAARIRWVDEVPLAELPGYYNLSDVVVSVPDSDGMPVTLFEAMACEKPLVVGDLSSYNEVIIHGQTGLRVPIHNPQVLARALVKIRKNPDLARRMVEESQVVLQQYGIFEDQMMRMERYYRAMRDGQVPRQHGFRRGLLRVFMRGVLAFGD